ncbi:kelch-like protein 10 [Limosa lapponica baueri]|uniref:Kelch-like protein 10 n=1 Tax=Limosa lapponica baueri TaxID=1758121 RepID=A0A2I0TJK7_LIMLA|nr:kelch-like protein 10 [Limosa lapponica baueri]
MVKALEHLSYEERLGVPGLLNLENRRLRGTSSMQKSKPSHVEKTQAYVSPNYMTGDNIPASHSSEQGHGEQLLSPLRQVALAKSPLQPKSATPHGCEASSMPPKSVAYFTFIPKMMTRLMSSMLCKENDQTASEKDTCGMNILAEDRTLLGNLKDFKMISEFAHKNILCSCSEYFREVAHVFILHHLEEMTRVSVSLAPISELEHILEKDELSVKGEEAVFEAIVQRIAHNEQNRRQHAAVLLAQQGLYMWWVQRIWTLEDI